MHIRTYACMHHVYVYVHVYISVYMCVCLRLCVYARARLERVVRLHNDFPTTMREKTSFDAEAAAKSAAMEKMASDLLNKDLPEADRLKLEVHTFVCMYGYAYIYRDVGI